MIPHRHTSADGLERTRSRETVHDVSEIVGPYTWGVLHHAIETFPCGPCAEHGGRLLRGLHDVVNVHLGKPLYAPEDFQGLVELVVGAARKIAGKGTRPAIARLEGEVARLAHQAGIMSYPRCSSPQGEKPARCVQGVKGRGGAASLYAVCTASMGCKLR